MNRDSGLRSCGTAVALWLMAALGGSELAAGPGREMAPASERVELQVGSREPRLPARPASPSEDRVGILVELEPHEQDASKSGGARQQVRNFARAVGGRVRHEFRLLPHVLYLKDVPRARLRDLESIPGVSRLHDNYRVHAALDQSVSLIQGTQAQINAAGLTTDGSGVRICVVDTGIDTDHIFYRFRIDLAASIDFIEGDGDPSDADGHGSHVAGIAAGGLGSVDLCQTGQPSPFQGVAPGATLISVRALDSTGSGTQADIMMGIDHCADPDLPGGPADVINLSLGGGLFSGTCDGELGAAAANAAVDAGVVVVAASGNDGSGTQINAPACASKVIAVGATWDADYPSCDIPEGTFEFPDANCTETNPTTDQRACFSNGGDELDVVAPGCAIWSASNVEGGSQVSPSCGTSMAAPHVAGLAALLLGLQPELRPQDVRELIRAGSIDLGAPGFDFVFGHGRIDVVNSLLLVVPCTGDEECQDGVFCNGEEICVDGLCLDGTPPDCRDDVSCTNDRCDLQSDRCVNIASSLRCSDGDICNGVETCDPEEDCVPGVPLECDDGIDCTEDSCNRVRGCTYATDSATCDNGDLCDGVETCVVGAGCMPGPPVADGTSCADEDLCNGEETCLEGSCAPGTPLPDRDGDQTCDLVDNCPDRENPDQSDGDGDTRGDVCDCEPAREDLWSTPGEVAELVLAHAGGEGGTSLLAWGAPHETGGTTLAYDSLRAHRADGFAADETVCAESDGGSDTQVTDELTPPAGQTRFFLIRAENECGMGPLGTGHFGDRPARVCP